MGAILADGMVRLADWDTRRLGEEPGVPWPVPPGRLAAATTAQRDVLLAHIEQPVGDPANDALRLAGHHFAVYAGAVAEAALGVAAEGDTGLRLEGVAEIDALRSGKDTAAGPTVAALAAESGAPRRHWLRRMARVASWTPAPRLPRAWFAPDAVAITHNGLLREAAERDGAIGFRHADEWLASITHGARSPSSEPARVLAKCVAAETARAIGVDEAIEIRAARLLTARLTPMMERAWHELHALGQARLPKAVWSGTGGFWPARAVGIEVMRRGGTVRRFDHGGGFGLMVDPQGARLIELAVSTEFVVTTAAQIAMLQRQLGEHCHTAIGFGRGDPHFRHPPGPARGPKQRPRVMYVASATLGFRYLWPPKPADFVYIDWQLRVARALAALDIDLVLKPHPEGLFRGRPHPLSSIASVETRPFEQVLDEIDVVIFDYPASTTFAYALGSRCPIIYLDNGLAEFEPLIAADLSQRLQRLPVAMDEEGRLHFDTDALAAAIFNRQPFDHTPFRRLLAGAAANE